MSREEFRLLHYAGEVNYNVNGKMKFICRSQLPNLSLLGAKNKTQMSKEHKWSKDSVPQSYTRCSFTKFA